MAKKGSFFMVALFLSVHRDHKIETKDNEKYFKFSKLHWFLFIHAWLK